MKNNDKRIEICNECGKDVSSKSGLFVNRVIDFDDYHKRKEMNKLFPRGDYICRECEDKLNNKNKKIWNFKIKKI